MNNVTQDRVKDIRRQKEGTGKGSIVLFCCVLFFLFQISASFDLSPSYPRSKTQLVVLPNQKIVLEDFDTQNSSGILSLGQSSESYQLTPFFFLPVAINFCDKTLLMSVKGIGPGLADRILQTRKKIGYFSAPKDLLQIKGIGPVRLRTFTPYFNFSRDHE